MSIFSNSSMQRAEILLSGFSENSQREEIVEEKERKLSLIDYSGISEKENKKINIILFAVAFIIVCVSVQLSNFIVLLGLPIVVAIKCLILLRKSSKRSSEFEMDYPAFLISLASSIRCGLDPLSAFLSCKDLFTKESPIYQAILESSNKIEEGVPEKDVINKFAYTIKHPDIALFRAAFILSRSEGSSLSKCLQRIAKVVRSRQSFRRKINAAVAMQKLSAFGIIGAVFGMFVLQLASGKEALEAAWNNPLGEKLIFTSITLISIGAIWMLKMTRSSVKE